ncbi:MAG: hypothetical protein JW863_13995 [Chitinispirillaceae bacterium]|nr:hypothetical protein [Chitinispirillaceae bacterium]
MIRPRNNERGFALVYALVVLLLATVGGTALLFLSRKDHISASDYSGMRIASQAATTAIKACEGQFLNDPNEALAILEKYYENPSAKTWLLGTAANAGTEQKIPLGSDPRPPRYSARIVGFDASSNYIVIEGNGYLSNGGRKRVLATYRLSGLKLDVTISPFNTIHVGSGFGNLDQTLIINGNVFAGGANMINGGGNGITINGDLKTGTGQFWSNEKITVNGRAYFRGSTLFQMPNPSGLFVNGRSGFEGDIQLVNNTNDKITATASMYINGNDLGDGQIYISGVVPDTALFYTSGGYNSAKINTTSPAKIDSTSSKIDLAAKLGMTNADDAAPSIRADLEDYITNSGGTIYSPTDAGLDFKVAGWNLTTAYSTRSLWKGFLVIKTTTGISPDYGGKDAGEFDGKVIWIIDGCSCNFQYFYNSTPNANTLVYLTNCSVFWNFGEEIPGTSPMFRGLIYNASTCTYSGNYKLKAGSVINGAIIEKATTRMQFNSASSSTQTTLNFDANALYEFVEIGILDLQSGVNVAKNFRLVDSKIRPTLMSIQM